MLEGSVVAAAAFAQVALFVLNSTRNTAYQAAGWAYAAGDANPGSPLEM